MSVLINGTNGLIQAYDYQTPATGFSYTFAAGTQTLVMNPAATLATGTITMPAAPSDGMTITLSSSKEITALTLNGNTGQTVVGAVSYLPANTSVAYVYRSANTSWFPMQAVPQLLNVPLGVGQTWTDVTASRSGGTTYTNTTGKPIFVSIALANTTPAYTVTINGLPAFRIQSSGTTGGNGTASFVVPVNNTYSTNVNAVAWYELR